VLVLCIGKRFSLSLLQLAGTIIYEDIKWSQGVFVKEKGQVFVLLSQNQFPGPDISGLVRPERPAR